MATNFDKIDCHQVKTLFYETYSQGKVSALEHSSAKSSVLKPHRIQAIIKYAFPALEVHGETAIFLIKCHLTFAHTFLQMAYASYIITVHIYEYRTITGIK